MQSVFGTPGIFGVDIMARMNMGPIHKQAHISREGFSESLAREPGEISRGSKIPNTIENIVWGQHIWQEGEFIEIVSPSNTPPKYGGKNRGGNTS